MSGRSRRKRLQRSKRIAAAAAAAAEAEEGAAEGAQDEEDGAQNHPLPPLAENDSVIIDSSQQGHCELPETLSEVEPTSRHQDEKASVVVDMGKVVGVLCAHVPSLTDEDLSMPSASGIDNPMVLVGAGGCTSCSAANKSGKVNGKDGPSPAPTGIGSSELDESLCGDPLMYATFVAPVHQYSTETEPSRQASFNYPSRQPSFKQNSSEDPIDLTYPPFPGIPAPHPEVPYSDEVRDIYEEVPVEQWPLPPLPPGASESDKQESIQEISRAELEHQLRLERLSFISCSSANEDDDDDDISANFPPLPPPPLQLRMADNHFARESTPMAHSSSLAGFDAHPYNPLAQHELGTVRRKAKRERNRTVDGTIQIVYAHDKGKRSKSRSKSRSPGQEISPLRSKSRSPSGEISPPRSKSQSLADEDIPPPPPPPHQCLHAKPRTESVVIVHNSKCSVHSRSRSRGASPDDISESSASFHENEFVRAKPNFQPRAWMAVQGGSLDQIDNVSKDKAVKVVRKYYKSADQPCVTLPRSRGVRVPEMQAPFKPHLAAHTRSSSRDSGSSSSRTTSRTGSRADSKHNRQRLKEESLESLDPGLCGCPPVLPLWMRQGEGAGSDCVELEAMAIPSASRALKLEAMLNNLHQRFKKDYVYVSNFYL